MGGRGMEPLSHVGDNATQRRCSQVRQQQCGMRLCIGLPAQAARGALVNGGAADKRLVDNSAVEG